MQDTRREDVGASKQVVCVKCGMPVSRDYSGWHHSLPPMSRADARRYRHVVKVAA